MRIRRGLGILLLLGVSLWAGPPKGPVPLAIAAAADLRGSLEELAETFQKVNPAVRIQVSYGASGGLAAQIEQGAPFDLFLSADLGYPERLVQAGLTTQEGVSRYATGELILWVRKELARKEGLQVLTNPAIKRIALANPRLAPYGRAGEEALKKSGLYGAVQARLIFAENVTQAAQYLSTGAAEAGLISRSQARQQTLRETGWVWPVPQEFYTPLQQGAVVLARTTYPNEARAFLAYLLGPSGQAILARNGFGKP